MKYVGFKGTWTLEERGLDLVRKATLEDITPNKEYYMVDGLNPRKFYKTLFSSKMDYSSITELVEAGKVFTRHSF